MSVRWENGLVAITLLVLGCGYAAAEEDTARAANGEQEEKKKEAAPEFPSELRLAPDKMPEPVRQNVLQRIDEHERLEQLLINQPLEIKQEKGTGD